MNKKYIGICVLVICVVTTSLFFFYHKNSIKKNRSKSQNGIDSIEVSLDLDNGDEKIDWTKYPTKNFTLENSITITEEGTYHLTGTIKDGSITIQSNGNVRLILDKVSITNSKGPAIYVKKAEDVVIVTKGDAYLEDGKNYVGYDSDVIGTIYSSSDITFDGESTLRIRSNCEDAIVGKDDLKVVNGNYEIISTDDGIRGKDSVYIKSGNFTIESGGDAIKSTNTKDTSKGFVYIENGKFNLNSSLDGIQAETQLVIENGTFQITTGGGSINSSDKDTWGNWGKEENINNSAKGLKAGINAVIKNGVFEIDSSDDSIHSNNSIEIQSGTFTISSGDDGIHADKEILIRDGSIDIKKSYEGIEASKITIENGDIKISSTDDGINVAGGKDSSTMNRPGANNYSSSENILTINGGNIYVDASGDGLDANGSIYMTGGTVIVDGPENSGNGALDYDKEFIVKGGTLFAGGSSGMAQCVSSNSTIYNLFINFSSNYGKDDKVVIVDANNKEILSYQSNKSFSSLVLASPLLTKGDYKIFINGDQYETFTISSITTQIGSSGGMNMRPGDRKPDRMPGGRRENGSLERPIKP